MEISSRENATFKELLKLTQKKFRRESGLCIVEGEKAVRDLKGVVKQVFVRKGRAGEKAEFVSRLFTDRKGAAGAGDLVVLDDKLFDLVTGLETDAGVAATVPIPMGSGASAPFLVLDRIQDAGNMGTILRTAAAFGFGTIFCIDCVDIWSQKVLRAGAGMQFSLNIIESGFDGFERAMGGELKGCLLVSADLGGGELELVKATVKKAGGKFGLVLGNEGQGVSEKIKGLEPLVATIPMDKGCESLNVAVAGGILMHLFSNSKLEG